LSLPCGHGTKGQSTFGFTSVKQAKVTMEARGGACFYFYFFFITLVLAKVITQWTLLAPLVFSLIVCILSKDKIRK